MARAAVRSGPTAAVRRAATAGAAGRESLGDGLSSLFVLESGFNLQNGKSGQGGLMFGRQAYVGLANQRYGTLTLGRQYDSLSDTVGMFPSSNNFATGYGSHFGDLNNLNQSIRINDAVKYVSPEFGGLRMHGMYSFGGQFGNYAANRSWALATAYTSGPLSMAIGYLDIHPPATRANGTGGVYESNGNYVGSLGQYVGLQDADAMKVIGAGASYGGAATIGFTYAHPAAQQPLFRGEWLSRSWQRRRLHDGQLRVDDELSVESRAVGRRGLHLQHRQGGLSGLRPKFHQINLGASYSLSKRTELYGVFIFQKAAGDGIAPLRGAAGAVIGAPRKPKSRGGREFGLQSADADDDGHHPSLLMPRPWLGGDRYGSHPRASYGKVQRTGQDAARCEPGVRTRDSGKRMVWA